MVRYSKGNVVAETLRFRFGLPGRVKIGIDAFYRVIEAEIKMDREKRIKTSEQYWIVPRYMFRVYAVFIGGTLNYLVMGSPKSDLLTIYSTVGKEIDPLPPEVIPHIEYSPTKGFVPKFEVAPTRRVRQIRAR